MKKILLVSLLVLYLFIRFNINHFYFQPAGKKNLDGFNDTDPKYKCMNIDHHYALYRKGDKPKVMIVAHGNAGSFLDRSYLIDKLDEYTGDIFLFEYPGFSGVKGKANIKSCVNELAFWVEYLKPHYNKIDLYGESIGGGIVIETCRKKSFDCINKIYLQSTFSSMKEVILNMNNKLYWLYKILLLDDLNSNKNLENVLCDKYVIIHSPTDELVYYEQAVSNYEKLKSLNKQVKFIQATGSHNGTIFKLKK